MAARETFEGGVRFSFFSGERTVVATLAASIRLTAVSEDVKHEFSEMQNS
jgi:hypothetical protein